MNELDTRKKIIDIAIRLIAENGYHRTSIREITQKANVNIASVNYHFGTKKNLAKEIINEIIGPLNALRLKKLKEITDTYAIENRTPSTRSIIEIFIEPALTLIASDNSGFVIHQFLLRTMTSSESEIKEFFHKIMSPVFINFLKALETANPHIQRKELASKLIFSIGSMNHSILLMNNQFPTKNFDVEQQENKKIIETLINFITSGIESK